MKSGAKRGSKGTSDGGGKRTDTSEGKATGASLASKSGAPKANSLKGKLAPGLYVVATPIGNLGDMTDRAARTLRDADLIACEDTRVTGGLKLHFDIQTPLTPYHDHNADQVRPGLLARIAEGGALALVSDAGTPLISDPGYKLVRACADAGHAVFPIPGASAMLAAAVTAGIATDRILFAGFLPNRAKARQDAIAELRGLAATLIFYESAQRLADTLADLATVLGARDAAVCRELTKLHEEVRRGTLSDLAARYAKEPTPKGEVVVVVAGAPKVAAEISAADIDAALREALQKLSLRDAAALVAEQLNQPRRAIYSRALELAKDP
jgi:16S rRNA (cytidine1402-2'-O)-methyltransferase